MSDHIRIGDILHPEEPLETAARMLREKMEHLEPSDRYELRWPDLSEWDKDFYRFCVEDLLERAELIEACLGQLAANNREGRHTETGKQ